MISVLTIGLDAWETEQMKVDEAFKVYNEMRNIRKGVIDNLIALLQKYYCNNIFEDDLQLYDLYNNIIPNSSMCDAHEKNVLRQEITKNRPDGLPAAIWLEHNYQKIKNNCQ
jgi:hypothetical protein